MTPPRMHDDEVISDEDLVRSLLADQFPAWTHLPVRRLPSDGTDHAIYRLGEDLVARLPLIHWAVDQVQREQLWLPRIAPHLPLAVPEPLAMGEPGHGYPWAWSVHRWIVGENAVPHRIVDERRAAADLAGFVGALQALDVVDAPLSARGVGLATKDESTRRAIHALRHELDAAALTAIWDEALAAPPWDGPPVWVHADLTDGNVLARDGRLHAVIDFGLLGLGEPANDLEPAWTVFTREGRAAYRSALGVDDATWARGRGWAVTSVHGMVYYRDTNPGIVARCRRRIAAVLADC